MQILAASHGHLSVTVVCLLPSSGNLNQNKDSVIQPKESIFKVVGV